MSRETSRKTNSGDSLGARLKRLRLQKRLSLKEMANAVDVPVTTYREWEYGMAIKGEPYAKIAEVLEISIAELLTGRTPSKTSIIKHLTLIEEHLNALRIELERIF